MYASGTKIAWRKTKREGKMHDTCDSGRFTTPAPLTAPSMEQKFRWWNARVEDFGVVHDTCFYCRQETKIATALVGPHTNPLHGRMCRGFFTHHVSTRKRRRRHTMTDTQCPGCRTPNPPRRPDGSIAPHLEADGSDALCDGTSPTNRPPTQTQQLELFEQPCGPHPESHA